MTIPKLKLSIKLRLKVAGIEPLAQIERRFAAKFTTEEIGQAVRELEAEGYLVTGMRGNSLWLARHDTWHARAFRRFNRRFEVKL